tara:strand:- start:382 stop:1278 length:897 start_codon:yes stop_codon:yes gene_type:complete
MLATRDGISEVRHHLTGLGLAQCTDAVVNEGFYTSVDALRVATYAGLLECGLQVPHAQLIVTSFGGKVPPEMTRGPGTARSAYLSSLDVMPPSCAVVSAKPLSPTEPRKGEAQGDGVEGAAEEVAEFLRMMGLGKYVDPVLAAGIVSIEHLVMASTEQLTDAGVSRRDAVRLVVSLDLRRVTQNPKLKSSPSLSPSPSLRQLSACRAATAAHATRADGTPLQLSPAPQLRGSQLGPDSRRRWGWGLSRGPVLVTLIFTSRSLPSSPSRPPSPSHLPSFHPLPCARPNAARMQSKRLTC